MSFDLPQEAINPSISGSQLLREFFLSNNDVIFGVLSSRLASDASRERQEDLCFAGDAQRK